jgi:hypothetical protein
MFITFIMTVFQVLLAFQSLSMAQESPQVTDLIYPVDVFCPLSTEKENPGTFSQTLSLTPYLT